MNVLAIIPARSGSKGIPDKNISTFNGKPMLAHSVECALQTPAITRVIVSTDSPIYAAIARQYGAETPFLRPDAISGDFATDLEVFTHALQWLARHEKYHPEIVVHLRPTHPIRRAVDIEQAVRLLRSDPNCDSVRTVVKAPETPFKMWFMDDNGFLKPVVQSDAKDSWNLPRQSLAQAYLQNAAIDVVWSRIITATHSMTGTRIRGLVMEQSWDIDTAEQLKAAATAARERPTGKTFVIDIDGVLASITPDNDYGQALPMRANIRVVNALRAAGNRVVLFTARGSATGIDWRRITEEQLASWGVAYDDLMFGKPAGDYYIDDRLIDLKDARFMTQLDESETK
jgi:CMP-N,N'-diacetyllegionaminic acid synthase